MTLDEITGENKVLDIQIFELEKQLDDLKSWRSQNEALIEKQLNGMAESLNNDCGLCLGYCDE